MPVVDLARVFTEPPSTSIRLSVPSAKKPIDLLSGDQNGASAPSVPGRVRGDSDRSDRTRSWLSGPEKLTKATVSPSGDIAAHSGDAVGGVPMSTRVSAGTAAGRSINQATASVISDAAIHAARSRQREDRPRV